MAATRIASEATIPPITNVGNPAHLPTTTTKTQLNNHSKLKLTKWGFKIRGYKKLKNLSCSSSCRGSEIQ